MLPEEEWSSCKGDLQVNESELKVRASVLATLIIPSVIVVDWGEVLHLEKAYWAVHAVDQVQVQPDVQGKESESTSRAADQEFDC